MSLVGTVWSAFTILTTIAEPRPEATDRARQLQ